MAESDDRARHEASIRATLERGDLRGAAEEAVLAFGPEVHGYVIATLRDDGLSQDAFSIFCENLWTGLPGFKWNSSLRTWLYAVARHACQRARRNKKRSRLWLNDAELASLEAQVRSQTATYMRTDSKDAVHELRAQLTEEEQELLILRIDRNMSWLDIAQVRLDGDIADEERLKREASACRKRFERTKERLKLLARERGLLKPED